jgi:phage tail-like protein
MPNDLIDQDPIVARNFTLDFEGNSIPLTGISGFEVEVDVVAVDANLPGGQQIHLKTRGGAVRTADVNLTRLAPHDLSKDPVWPWFIAVRDAGGPLSAGRKDGSIVLKRSDGSDAARYNFFGGWISKITISDMNSGSNDPVQETITLVSDRMERIV